MSYLPTNGGTVLPIARLGRLGWFIEGPGWTMAPRGHLTLSEEKQICAVSAAALRAALGGGTGDGGRDG